MHAVSLALLSLLLLTPFPGGWLGVYLTGDERTAVVSEVIPGSPAAQAGVEAGDVLLAIDGRAIRSQADLRERVVALAAGSKIEVKVRRGDVERVLKVRLGEQPTDGESGAGAPPVPPAPAAVPGRPAMPAPAPASEAASGERGYLGISVRETEDGVVVDRVVANGPAAAAGVQAGERLRSIAGKPVVDLEGLDALLQPVRPGQKVELQLVGQAGTRSLVVVAGRRAAAGEPSVEVVPIEPTPPNSRPHPAPPSAPAAPTAHFDLERELRELRAELAEMRRILQAMQEQQERQAPPPEPAPEPAAPPARRQRRGR